MPSAEEKLAAAVTVSAAAAAAAITVSSEFEESETELSKEPQPFLSKGKPVEETPTPANRIVYDDDDDDDGLNDLDDDAAFMANIREKRMQELRKQYRDLHRTLSHHKRYFCVLCSVQELEEMKQREHGTYLEILTEKEVLSITTSARLCVVHFFHKEFRRCMIMDKHLEVLARKHFQTKFVKIEVENAPFLVDRLSVQILPCVMCFIDGISVDRVVGFEELGNTDNFELSVLEKRLALHGIISLGPKTTTQIKRKTIYGKTRGADSGSEEVDSD